MPMLSTPDPPVLVDDPLEPCLGARAGIAPLRRHSPGCEGHNAAVACGDVR